MADDEPQVVRPFSTGPIWGPKKTEEIQEDLVSSSTTNFAITLGEGKRLRSVFSRSTTTHRTLGENMYCMYGFFRKWLFNNHYLRKSS